MRPPSVYWVTKIIELRLIDRDVKNAEWLKADLIGTYPNYGNKILVGYLESANASDIILITAGLFGIPIGSLWNVNRPIIESIFTKLKLKNGTKIIITTTPSGKTAQLAWKLSGLKHSDVVGFGGQPDVNRLKYLIFSDTKNFSKDFEVHFIAEHGKRGIPIFREKVSNRDVIIDQAKNYFKIHLEKYNASTYGTASELAKLVGALMSKESISLDVSHYDLDNGIFITWPCIVNEDGISGPIKLDLTDKEKAEFNNLIMVRKEENDI